MTSVPGKSIAISPLALGESHTQPADLLVNFDQDVAAGRDAVVEAALRWLRAQ